MKKLFVLFILITGSIFAQNAERINIAKCEEIIIYSLRSHNEGVVLSMISNLVQNKLSSRAEIITDNVLKELDKLVFTGNTEKIRKTAGLAFAFLSANDRQLLIDVKFRYNDEDKLFKIISDALQNRELKLAGN